MFLQERLQTKSEEIAQKLEKIWNEEKSFVFEDFQA